MNDDLERKQSVDRFLKLIQKSKVGKLKIYLGFAAGVGKTYRMLQEARELYYLGIDICIGYVESHNREETKQMILEEIEKIPLKKIFYKGKELEEVDIDRILMRRPEIILIDELAHTNVEGSRNKKRWEDIEEILNSGINVISAANIQHIESLNPIVEQITNVKIEEKIPDRMLKIADEIVNVDLTIDELINRIKLGKVYPQNRIETALSNFFKEENLLQLRELSLREVASQVGRKVDSEIIFTENKKKSEKIIACIGTDKDYSKKIMMKCSRLAGELNAKWFAIHIENYTEDIEKIDLKAQKDLMNNLEYAIELGGEVFRIKGNNISKEIIRFAIENNVNKILLGRPNNSFIKKLLFRRLLNNIIIYTKEYDIDIYIV